MDTIQGIILKHGENDYTYWRDFSLTDKEKEIITEIVKNHETEGFSIRGTMQDISAEITVSGMMQYIAKEVSNYDAERKTGTMDKNYRNKPGR